MLLGYAMSDPIPNLVPCSGCRGLFPDSEGPTHPYLESSPGCAAACGELFACHYQDVAFYGDVYRLANDAYADRATARRFAQAVSSSLWRVV